MHASHRIRSKFASTLPLLLITTLLTGCPTQPPEPQPPTVIAEPGLSSQAYLTRLQHSSPDEKPALQLLAARALLNEGKIEPAAQMLNALPTPLSDTQSNDLLLLQSAIALARQDRVTALSLLDKLKVDTLSTDQKMHYYQVQMDARQGAPTLATLRAMIAGSATLPPQTQAENQEKIWRALQLMNSEQRDSRTVRADEKTLLGWLTLAQLYTDNQQNVEQLKTVISAWRADNPQHPAAQQLPAQLSALLQEGGIALTKVALLLPQQGQAKIFSDAIEKGIRDAANGAQLTLPSASNSTETLSVQNSDIAAPLLPPPPLASESPPESTAMAPPSVPSEVQIRVYDTASQPLANVLAEAERDGAQMVIGPLLKPQVDQLSSVDSPLNILALNQPEQITLQPNICYFALSPEDEARDAARHIRAQGKNSPLILVPRGELGQRVSHAFAEAWQQEGGNPPLKQIFGSPTELKATINQGMGIRLTGDPIQVPNHPASALVEELTQPGVISDTVTASGGGVDAVYIIATPAEMSLIKPMLDMNGGAERPALYASSRSYMSHSGSDYRFELEGVEYGEIPLLATQDKSLQQQLTTRFNNDYMLIRLYAMGRDAWQLAQQFAKIRQDDAFHLNGFTGLITVQHDCRLSRKPSWLKFQQGELLPVP